MLNTILRFFVGSIFSAMGWIYTRSVSFIDFNQRDIGYLIEGIDQYLPAIGAIRYDSVIYAFAIAVILWNVMAQAIKMISSPVTGAKTGSVGNLVVRVGVAFGLIVLSGDIQTQLFSLLDGFITQVGLISASTWVDEIVDLVLNFFGEGNMFVALVFAVILFFQFVQAIIAYVERYILFGINMIISPAAMAFISSEEGSDIPKQWLQSTIHHFASLVLAQIMLSLFMLQVGSFGSESSLLSFFISMILLGLVKNSEKLLSMFGIRSIPTGGLMRDMAVSMGTIFATYRFARGFTRFAGAATNLARDIKSLPGGLSALGTGNINTMKSGEMSNPYHEGGKTAAKNDYVPKADKNGILQTVNQDPDKAAVNRAVNQQVNGYTHVPVVSSAERGVAKKGYYDEHKAIKSAVDNVRQVQQGFPIQTNADGSCSNIFYPSNETANGMKPFTGSVKDLASCIGTGDTEKILYSDFNADNVKVDENGNVANAFVQDSRTNTGAYFNGTPEELKQNLNDGFLLNAQYEDKDGNKRNFLSDDVKSYTPYVSGSDFNKAFGIDKTMPDGSGIVEDTSARFGGFHEVTIDGEARMIPTFGAGAEHLEGKTDHMMVVSADPNFKSDAISSGVDSIDPSRYTNLGGGYKAYTAPMQVVGEDGQVNKDYGEFVHTVDPKRFSETGERIKKTNSADQKSSGGSK